MTFSAAEKAMLELYSRAEKTRNIEELERIDRALDEIVNHLDRTAPAAYQCRNALSNASKAIGKRRAVRSFRSLDKPMPDGTTPDPGEVDGDFDVVDLRRWLNTTRALNPEERQLLLDLADGEDAASLSPRCAVPTVRMRERISRTRSRGRSAYRTETS
ncbi:hypothetical protein ACQP1O_33125 [Nocardia sp. CA-151230]|uniref:hypothetical protein n=1 Tax=Nocardia sp. CA-151230 TaxID=3239982 RepID=UPI003D944ADC